MGQKVPGFIQIHITKNCVTDTHPSALSISRFTSRKREMETHAEVTVHAEAAVPA